MAKKCSNTKQLLYEIVFYIFCICVTAFFWKDNIITFVILAVGWMIAIILWHTKEDVIVYIIAAITGPIAEIILVNTGAWSYANPTAFGIPIWLPLIWGMTGVMIKRFGKTFSDFI